VLDPFKPVIEAMLPEDLTQALAYGEIRDVW
jgi:hypothetical protein